MQDTLVKFLTRSGLVGRLSMGAKVAIISSSVLIVLIGGLEVAARLYEHFNPTESSLPGLAMFEPHPTRIGRHKGHYSGRYRSDELAIDIQTNDLGLREAILYPYALPTPTTFGAFQCAPGSLALHPP